MTLPPNSSPSLSGQANALLLSAADIQMTQKNFSFAKKFSLPLYFVSAADGTNVVKVMANQRQSAEVACHPGVHGGGKGKRENEDSEWLGAGRGEAGRTPFGETKSTDCGLGVMKRYSGG